MQDLQDRFAQLMDTRGADEPEITTAVAFERLLDVEVDGVTGRACFRALIQHMTAQGPYRALAQPRLLPLTVRQSYAAKFMWSLITAELTDDLREDDAVPEDN